MSDASNVNRLEELGKMKVSTAVVVENVFHDNQ